MNIGKSKSIQQHHINHIKKIYTLFQKVDWHIIII